ncbi:MAG TPA: hypothetical protein VEX86_10960 [Longimicrobium sp.]|nr:hypothetical protein [Longimicrobium sp.]
MEANRTDPAWLAAFDVRREQARHESAALRARARVAKSESRQVVALSMNLRGGVKACKKLWDALRTVPRADRELPVCRVCGRVCTPARRWTPVPPGVLHRLIGYPGVIRLTRAVCPHCSGQQSPEV